MSAAEKRRSDRLRLTIPLRVRGVDARGEVFQTSARTVILSRYGAQVQIPRALSLGQTVCLVNHAAQVEADFRVVELLSSSPEKGGEYGVECLDPKGNLWQILFPSLSDDDVVDARALLQCRMCNTVWLANLSIGELEALREVGIVAKTCQICNVATPSRYAEMSSTSARSDQGWMAQIDWLSKPRRHRRICLQVPLGVRDHQDRIDVTRTENVSRGGFCFTSDMEYKAGQQVRVVFPGEKASREIEVPGQVVWHQPMQKTERRVYGIRCERPAD